MDCFDHLVYLSILGGTMSELLLAIPLFILSAMGIFIMVFCAVQMFYMTSEAIDWLLNKLN